MELSIVMPCLNEARTLPVCIRKALTYLRESGVDGEVIVADNGSTDGSMAIAEELGARVVHVPAKGYGAALSAGMYEAEGTFVIMGDSDDSYNFLGLQPFVDKLREGYDLVMGNRFQGGISGGQCRSATALSATRCSAPSAAGSTITRSAATFIADLRAFRRAAILPLNIQSTGMDFGAGDDHQVAALPAENRRGADDALGRRTRFANPT